MRDDYSFRDNRGWGRASIELNTRSEYRPNINQADLLLPDEAGLVRTLAICGFCAFAMTILYVSMPLFMLSMFVPLGDWFGAIVFGSFPIFMFVLVWLSMREDRQLAREKDEL